jgi:hypothetical protein
MAFGFTTESYKGLGTAERLAQFASDVRKYLDLCGEKPEAYERATKTGTKVMFSRAVPIGRLEEAARAVGITTWDRARGEENQLQRLLAALERHGKVWHQGSGRFSRFSSTRTNPKPVKRSMFGPDGPTVLDKVMATGDVEPEDVEPIDYDAIVNDD